MVAEQIPLPTNNKTLTHHEKRYLLKLFHSEYAKTKNTQQGTIAEIARNVFKSKQRGEHHERFLSRLSLYNIVQYAGKNKRGHNTYSISKQHIFNYLLHEDPTFILDFLMFDDDDIETGCSIITSKYINEQEIVKALQKIDVELQRRKRSWE